MARSVNPNPGAPQLLFEFSGRSFSQMWSPGKDAPAVLVFVACAAMLSRPRAPGELPETGGRKVNGGYQVSGSGETDFMYRNPSVTTWITIDD